MRKPLICRPKHRYDERGITIVLVALAMVAIIGMAVLSIDLVTLYLAKEEAQRSADEAALAAARILSISGITGDPSNSSSNWGAICGPTGVATQAAQAVVAQNTVAGLAASTSTVTYSAGSNGTVGAGTTDCATLSSTAFGVNPMVTVNLTRPNLPTFFSRFWGNTGQTVTATATAEAFNPSYSGITGNQNTSGPITPVQPWCVKPWAVANQDPWNPPPSGGNYCNMAGGPGACLKIVQATGATAGQLIHPGITADGSGTGSSGIIGEKFWLVADCRWSQSACYLRRAPPSTGPELQPQANLNTGSLNIQGLPNLSYVPSQVDTTVSALPSCAGASEYFNAIAGCDQPANYSCGVQNANVIDTTIYPDLDTSNAVQCLTHQNTSGDVTQSTGQDYLKYDTIFGNPSAYPFQILAGSANPAVTAPNGVPVNTPITSSASIVALPIYDSPAVTLSSNTSGQQVTFVGFLQVFINAVDQKGNILVTVLNVAGCSNGTTPVGSSVTGTSPVPIRLITPP